MKPTIGRIVHYKTDDGTTLPAIILAVHSDTCVNLEVFGAGLLEDSQPTSVLEGTGTAQWQWPPRA